MERRNRGVGKSKMKLKDFFKKKEKEDEGEVIKILAHKTGIFCQACSHQIFPDQPSVVSNGKRYHKSCLRKMKRKMKKFMTNGNMTSLR